MLFWPLSASACYAWVVIADGTVEEGAELLVELAHACESLG